MKVLYLSYDGMTDPLGQSQVIPYLRGLAQLGHEIHIVSFEKPLAFAAQKETIAQILNAAHIVWHPQQYTKKPPVLSTLKDLWVLRRVCKKLHHRLGFDLLHCRSYLTSLIALSFKNKYGIPFVFDMRGFWADERVEGKIWNISNPLFNTIYKYFKKKEIQFLNQSARIISLTHAAKAEIYAWPAYTGGAEKIKVIPCCADLEHFSLQSNMQKSAVRHSLGIEDKKLVISYVGSLGTWYMADEMLVLFKRIKEVYSEALLLLITTHSQAEVNTYLSQHGIVATDVVVKAGKRHEMPSLIGASDLSMFFVRPTLSKKASSPTKMGEIMGCGIPLICNSGVGDVESIVQQSACGLCISDFSEASLQKVVQQIPKLLQLDSQKIRHAAEQYYALKEGVARYEEVYASIRRSKETLSPLSTKNEGNL